MRSIMLLELQPIEKATKKQQFESQQPRELTSPVTTYGGILN